MKSGTRIQVRYIKMDGTFGWEDGKIARRMAYMMPIPDGYVPVRFSSDNGRMLVPAEYIRMVDNR